MAKAGSRLDGKALAKAMNASVIIAMDRDGLVALWPTLMGCPVPRAMSLGLLRRFLAYEVQARSNCGLGRADLERLERLADGRGRAKTTTMAAGARFLREWNGVTHVVERTVGGYRWNGRVFASLSGIAKEITGAHWSGPRFFGVKAAGIAVGFVAKPVRSAKKGARA